MKTSSPLTPLSLARAVFDIEIDALKKVRDQQGKNFLKAVELIKQRLQQKNKIVVSGIGKSGLIGQKIAATLTSTGATSVVLDATNALHGDLGIINEGDILLMLSNSGETEELLKILPAVKKMDIHIISLLGRENSSIARHSEIVLSARVSREACPHNLAPTASTTAMLALGDALAMVLLQERGFRKENFAQFHPGGAIGQALLTQAREVMRPPHRMAQVSPQTKVSETLNIMAKARSGCAVVTNARGKLAGIFTHGDFARCYSSDHGVGEKMVQKVMTKHPITIFGDALAADAIRLLKTHLIDDLVVIDHSHRPLGLIDSQDLPRLKLV